MFAVKDELFPQQIKRFSNKSVKLKADFRVSSLFFIGTPDSVPPYIILEGLVVRDQGVGLCSVKYLINTGTVRNLPAS